MSLTLYNTQTQQKEVFTPITPQEVRLYVCGPTVYDYAHIGNARPVVVFDILYRLLSNLYPKVTYVRNITDVDDKINAAAAAQNVSIQTITEKTTKMFHQDMDALHALRPTHEPRATHHINDMIALITELIKDDMAYVAENHVLFHVPAFKDYGKLSRRSLDDMIHGARVEVAPYKKHAADFVLWKPSQKGEPGWDSLWGYGRPGWHIECSAMSKHFLGTHFDIHGGGLDLIFPHHENEIAQSECANHTPFVNYWLHNGFVVVNGQKMSKSLGNFLTVHELLKEYSGEVIRLVLLSTHYRQPLDFTKSACAQAKNKLDRLYGVLQEVGKVMVDEARAFPSLLAPLFDDLNTADAINRLLQATHEFHKTEGPEKTTLGCEIITAAKFLGLLQQEAQSWFQSSHNVAISPAEIEALIQERENARRNKDFQRADEIRKVLLTHHIILEDKPTGTIWRKE